MKKLLFLISCLLPIVSFSQEIKYKEYSYTEFLSMIEKETDSVFKLENAIVKYDSITDKEFLVPNNYGAKRKELTDENKKLTINKRVDLENIQFISYQDFTNRKKSSLHDIIFKKPVVISNSFLINFSNCEFKSKFELVNYEYEKFEAFEKKYPKNTGYNEITKSQFSDSIRIIQSSTSINTEANRSFGFTLSGNIFDNSIPSTFIAIWRLQYVYVGKNTFNSLHPYYIQIEETNEVIIEDNRFKKGLPQLYCIEIEEFNFKDNWFNTPSLINLKVSNSTNFIGGNTFNDRTSSLDGFNNYRQKLAQNKSNLNWWYYNTIEYYNKYENEEKIQNLTYYQYELDQKSVFYNYFKERHNTTEANKYYTQIKDIENQRLVYEYELEPNFNKYFKIKINKFLKLFSNYGTEPERAVIVSLYVILFFAFIYLLFPNSWDSLGKKRLMHRFEFFQKYLRRKEGMHTLYLEEKQHEISSYEDFKNNLEQAYLELPSFFITWSKPLYNVSMFSSRVMARFLKTTDVLQGKWKDLTPKQKRWKNIQIGLLLIIGLLYDLFIKVLNALMLSINTFTTLGFGEIPIKGLPRYLAIIQGFIGWFMLTIFSVSLISQLLN